MHCGECGIKIDDDSIFCVNCGSKIELEKTTTLSSHRKKNRLLSKKRKLIIFLAISFISGWLMSGYLKSANSSKLFDEFSGGAGLVIEKMANLIENDRKLIDNSESIKTKLIEMSGCIAGNDYDCVNTKINEATRIEGQQDVLYEQNNNIYKELQEMLGVSDTNSQQI